MSILTTLLSALTLTGTAPGDTIRTSLNIAPDSTVTGITAVSRHEQADEHRLAPDFLVMADLAAHSRDKRSFTTSATLSLEASLALGRGWAIDAETVWDKDDGAELAQLWIEYSIIPSINLRAGRFNAPLGRPNRYDTAADFFTVNPFEPQNGVLPGATWRVTGLSIYGAIPGGPRFNHIDYEVQVLGFGADTLGLKPGILCRLDFFPTEQFQVGAGIYSGPAADSLSLTTAIYAADLAWAIGPATLRGYGTADRFRRYALGCEAGIDLLSTLRVPTSSRLDLFATYAFEHTPTRFENAGYARRLSAGLNLSLRQGIIVKAEWGTEFSGPDYIGLGLSFIR